MISAISGELEPAGMFYFNIKDQMESLNDKDNSQAQKVIDEEASAAFKLRGVYVDEPGVLEAMPEKVLPARKQKISRGDFEETKQEVTDRINEMAESILSGDIPIKPLIVKNNLVCTYCKYKPICKKDREYKRNSGREISATKKEPKEETKEKSIEEITKDTTRDTIN